jgi:selenocysteine lyase/cysteine desulfurase
VLAHALRPLWKDGDRVVVSVQNHEANSGPWRRLAETGIEVVDWPVDPATGALTDLRAVLTERTRLVAFPHVSNVLGAINDVTAITRQAHDSGALVSVDGVAFAPHRAIDVKAWDVDFYLFSFYKVFGPHMGCLYGKKELLQEAKGQYHYFIGEDETAKKLNPAGPQHEMIAALTGIADYFEALAVHHLSQPPNDFHGRVKAVMEIATAHEETLARRFAEFAAAKPGLRLIGPESGEATVRAPTFSFLVDGVPSAEVPRRLLADRIAVSNGHFYAKRLVEAVGVADSDDGVVRASMAHYNTLDEVDRLIGALDRIAP